MKYIGLVLLLLFSQLSTASVVSTTKVKYVLGGDYSGSLVYVGLTSRPGNAPACHNNPDYDYIFDASTEAGKITLSLVLTAYTTGKDIWISGTDTCNLKQGMESLRLIWLK